MDIIEFKKLIEKEFDNNYTGEISKNNKMQKGKSKYKLKSFINYDGKKFVDNAFDLFEERQPDIKEYNYFLAKMYKYNKIYTLSIIKKNSYKKREINIISPYSLYLNLKRICIHIPLFGAFLSDIHLILSNICKFYKMKNNHNDYIIDFTRN